MSHNRSSSPSPPPSGCSGPSGPEKSPGRTVAEFLGLAILAYILLFLAFAYPLHPLVPRYKAITAKGATVALRLFFHEGREKQLTYHEGEDSYRIKHSRMQGDAGFPGKSIHYNVVILLALIIASPRLRIRQKLVRGLIGLGILYLLHALQLALTVEEIFSTKVGTYSEMHYSAFMRGTIECLSKFFEVFGQQLLPFAIWAFLCAPVVLDLVRGRKKSS